MTKEEFKEIVIGISELTNDDEEVMTRLKTLQDGFNSVVDSPTIDNKWENQYNELLTKYRERFFNGGEPTDTTPPTPLDESPLNPDDLYNEILQEVTTCP